MTNPQNKSDKFTGVASDRFKTYAIETHNKSGCHKSAVEAELILKNVSFPQGGGRKKRNRNICARESIFNSLFSYERVFTKQKISST